MINPNRIHRTTAVIHALGNVESKVRVLKTGAVITAWTSDLPKDSKVGDFVNIQANFSITMDAYCCNTVRRCKRVTGVICEYLADLAYKSGLRFEYREFLNVFVVNGVQYGLNNITKAVSRG